MDESNEAVRLEHVSKRYGAGPQHVVALKDVNLVIPKGEFLSVMGPSGSGKSTLLNMIAGLDVASQGTVVILGRDLAGLSDNARSYLAGCERNLIPDTKSNFLRLWSICRDDCNLGFSCFYP